MLSLIILTTTLPKLKHMRLYVNYVSQAQTVILLTLIFLPKVIIYNVYMQGHVVFDGTGTRIYPIVRIKQYHNDGKYYAS